MIVLPNTNIRILQPIPDLSYFDRQNIQLPGKMAALAAWNAIIHDPHPFLKLAFKLHDAVSSVFGVKRIGGFSGKPVDQVSVGQQLDFFLVEYVDDTCLVMTCISIEDETLSVTSSVCVHNLFGRTYMIPVGVAHRWIVRGMFRRLRKRAEIVGF